MNLLKPSRYYAYVFESLFLKVLNEEPQDSLMICADLQMALPLVSALAAFGCRLEFPSRGSLVGGEGVEAHETHMVDVLAAEELVGLRLQIVFGALGGNGELEAVGQEGLTLD